MKRTRRLLVLLLASLPLWGAGAEEGEEKKEEILVESLRDQKRDILLYGIDTEVLDVISTIRSERDDSFDEELGELLEGNENPEINRAVFDFFSTVESDRGAEKALRLVEDHLEDYEFSVNLILSAISYLSSLKEPRAGELFYRMMRDKNKSLAGAALRGIGKLGDDSQAGEILSFYEENEGESGSEDLLGAAVAVLGELRYEEAAELFEEILLDEDAPSVQRQNAAVSLGQLQGDRGFEVLKEQYLLLSDSILRSYVLRALSEYEKAELEGILISALRDSFWRIRVAAGEGLGERKAAAAVDILIYKVKRDPVRQVRYAALEALGEIGNSQAETFILKQFTTVRNPFDIRSKALNIMLENQIGGSVEALEEVLEDKWEKDKDNELGAFCKVLSTAEWAALAPFYEAMMEHADFIIRIYGVRGVKINGLASFRGRLQELDAEDQPVNLRREVKAALDEL